jgi:hypothetical protein
VDQGAAVMPGVVPGRVRGIAHHVNVDIDDDQWVAWASTTTLSFRIERTDDPQLPMVQVALRGSAISGDVVDGDEVEVDETYGPTGAIVVDRVVNHSTGAFVVARGRRTRTVQHVVLAVFILAIVGFMAYIGYRMATAPDGPPPQFPGMVGLALQR